jgi:hypothetical protein
MADSLAVAAHCSGTNQNGGMEQAARRRLCSVARDVGGHVPTSLRQPKPIDPERSAARSAGSTKRLFEMIAPIIEGIADQLRFNMDEIMLAISRSRKVFVTQEERLLTTPVDQETGARRADGGDESIR